MRKKRFPELQVVYTVECEPFGESPRGYFASGEDKLDRELDRELENEILERLSRGDVWAWCSVRVRATADNGDFAYSDWLGGCSYWDAADYRETSGYFEDQCQEALDRLFTFEQSHRQGIQTKYFGPTDSKGSRVKVWAQAGSMYVSWDHALDPSENHAAAAKAFAERWGWTGRWLGAALPDGTGYCFANERTP